MSSGSPYSTPAMHLTSYQEHETEARQYNHRALSPGTKENIPHSSLKCHIFKKVALGKSGSDQPSLVKLMVMMMQVSKGKPSL